MSKHAGIPQSCVDGLVKSAEKDIKLLNNEDMGWFKGSTGRQSYFHGSVPKDRLTGGMNVHTAQPPGFRKHFRIPVMASFVGDFSPIHSINIWLKQFWGDDKRVPHLVTHPTLLFDLRFAGSCLQVEACV